MAGAHWDTERAAHSSWDISVLMISELPPPAGEQFPTEGAKENLPACGKKIAALTNLHFVVPSDLQLCDHLLKISPMCKSLLDTP